MADNDSHNPAQARPSAALDPECWYLDVHAAVRDVVTAAADSAGGIILIEGEGNDAEKISMLPSIDRSRRGAVAASPPSPLGERGGAGRGGGREGDLERVADNDSHNPGGGREGDLERRRQGTSF